LLSILQKKEKPISKGKQLNLTKILIYSHLNSSTKELTKINVVLTDPNQQDGRSSLAQKTAHLSIQTPKDHKVKI